MAIASKKPTLNKVDWVSSTYAVTEPSGSKKNTGYTVETLDPFNMNYYLKRLSQGQDYYEELTDKFADVTYNIDVGRTWTAAQLQTAIDDARHFITDGATVNVQFVEYVQFFSTVDFNNFSGAGNLSIFTAGYNVNIDATTDILTTTFAPTGGALQNGDAVFFDYMSSASGVTNSFREYYVINVSGSTFQLSTTVGGSPVNFLTSLSTEVFPAVVGPSNDTTFRVYDNTCNVRYSVFVLSLNATVLAENFNSGSILGNLDYVFDTGVDVGFYNNNSVVLTECRVHNIIASDAAAYLFQQCRDVFFQYPASALGDTGTGIFATHNSRLFLGITSYPAFASSSYAGNGCTISGFAIFAIYGSNITPYLDTFIPAGEFSTGIGGTIIRADVMHQNGKSITFV